MLRLDRRLVFDVFVNLFNRMFFDVGSFRIMLLSSDGFVVMANRRLGNLFAGRRKSLGGLLCSALLSLRFRERFAGQRFEARDPTGWSFRAAVFATVMPATVVSSTAAKSAAAAPIAIPSARIARKPRLIGHGRTVRRVIFFRRRHGRSARYLFAGKLRGSFGVRGARGVPIRPLEFGSALLGQACIALERPFGVGERLLQTRLIAWFGNARLDKRGVLGGGNRFAGKKHGLKRPCGARLGRLVRPMRSVFGLRELASVAGKAAGAAIPPTRTTLAPASSAATISISSASATVGLAIACRTRFSGEWPVVILAIANALLRIFNARCSAAPADGFAGERGDGSRRRGEKIGRAHV